MFFVYLKWFVDIFFQIMFFAIFGRVLLSWFPMRPTNPFYPLWMILFQVTEPILGPLRRIIPTIGMIDISPMIALIALTFIQSQLDALLHTRAF